MLSLSQKIFRYLNTIGIWRQIKSASIQIVSIAKNEVIEEFETIEQKAAIRDFLQVDTPLEILFSRSE